MMTWASDSSTKLGDLKIAQFSRRVRSPCHHLPPRSPPWEEEQQRQQQQERRHQQLVQQQQLRLLQILPSKLLHHKGHLLPISLNPNRAEDFLDVGFVNLSSSKGSKCGGGNVTHFKSLETRNGSTALL